MKKQSYIYFLSNTYNNVLYIGVTNDIIRRIAEHKAKINKGFTYKYNCDKLVYYEIFSLMSDAISREKQLKNWKREWKNKLINDFNSKWLDLSEEIGVTNEVIKAIKKHYKEIAGQARNDERQQSEQKATEEYDEFNKTQKIVSDFDKHITKLKKSL
jgi:putative endonuclease